MSSNEENKEGIRLGTLFFYVVIDIVALSLTALAAKHSSRSHISRRIRNNQYLIIKQYEIYLVLSFTVLFCVAAFRDGVGRDYESYANAFVSSSEGTLTQSQKNWLSVGYRILSQVVSTFCGDNYVIMFAVVSFITLLFFYKAIYRLSCDWTLSLYLIICFCLYYQSFNQMRQMLALSISIYALVHLRDERIGRYVIWILIAASIHTSAVVMLLLVLVGKWNITLKTVFIYLSTAAISYLGFELIIYLVSFTNYGQTYLGWEKYDTSFELSSVLNLFVRMAILCACLFVSKDVINRVPYAKVLYNCALICTVLQVITLQSYLFGRVTTYFFTAYIFLIPEVISAYEKKMVKRNRVLIKMITYILFASYHFVYYFSDSGAYGSGYDIYKSLLF